MKYTAILSVLALAATAIAVPWGGGGGGGGSSSTCNSDNEQVVCCASILNLICLVDAIGGSCGSSAYCCDNGASVVSFPRPRPLKKSMSGELTNANNVALCRAV